MRNFLGLALAAAILLPSGVGAQNQITAGDTILMTVVGDLADVMIVEYPQVSPRIGEVVYFRAQAVDSDGDPVPAAFLWESSDSTVLRFTQMSDSVAMAVGVSKGTVEVTVTVTLQGPDRLVLGFLHPGGRFDYGSTSMRVGETCQGCAFLSTYLGETVNVGLPECAPFVPLAMTESVIIAGLPLTEVRPWLT